MDAVAVNDDRDDRQRPSGADRDDADGHQPGEPDWCRGEHRGESDHHGQQAATTGTRAPKRSVTTPLKRLPAIAKKADGRNTSPAFSGDRPRCCCRYRATTKTFPKLPTMNAKPHRQREPEPVRLEQVERHHRVTDSGLYDDEADE